MKLFFIYIYFYIRFIHTFRNQLIKSKKQQVHHAAANDSSNDEDSSDELQNDADERPTKRPRIIANQRLESNTRVAIVRRAQSPIASTSNMARKCRPITSSAAVVKSLSETDVEFVTSKEQTSEDSTSESEEDPLRLSPLKKTLPTNDENLSPADNAENDPSSLSKRLPR